MAEEYGQDRENELAGRQPTALYPIGRALRATYDAENHDSLGTDLTGLMLALARVEPPADAPPAAGDAPAATVSAPSASPTPSAPPAAGRSWLARVIDWLLHPARR